MHILLQYERLVTALYVEIYFYQIIGWMFHLYPGSTFRSAAFIVFIELKVTAMHL